MIPLLTVLMSYFIFKKGLNKTDMGILGVSFVGVVVLILGATDESDEVDESVPAASGAQAASLVLPIITLIIQPFIGAAIPIMSKKIRSLHEFTISSYTALAMFFLYGAIVVSLPG
jgi:drug/metabolite transporter (DMT)-like permease